MIHIQGAKEDERGIVTYCEECGEPIYEDEETVVVQGLICHNVCPSQALDHYIQTYAKQSAIRETQEWEPSAIDYTGIYDGDGNEILYYPAKDIREHLEEIRFILVIGCSMGELGSIPTDWEKDRVKFQETKKRAREYMANKFKEKKQ